MISDATMGSPLFVPDSLKFYVNRLAFSKNRVRLQALSSTTAKSGSQVIVRLPSNTLVNLASLTMTGAVRAYFDGTPAADDGVALPTNWDFSFIETLSLIANGGIITQPFVNYKLLGNILNDINGSALMDQKRSALQGSLPQPIQTRGTVAADAQGGWLPFSINNWISATQTMAPSYMSTNLLGDLELRLTMADNSVVQSGDVSDGSAASVTTAAWEMKNINFYIETASIGNNLVDQAVAAKLAAGEPINVPFENVFSFSQANSGPTFNQRFSVSSQSVNKILVTTQTNTDIGTSGQKKFVNGIPQALRRDSLSAYQAQFSVNNQYSPNYQIDSGNVKMYDPIDGTNTKNLQFSNALVETRAAMDIPDYDYDCCDQLCTVPQMPVEYFGAGDFFDGANNIFRKIQPGSDQLFADTSAQDYALTELAFASKVTGGVLVKVKTSDTLTELSEWNDTGWVGVAKPSAGTFYFANAASATDTGASVVTVVAVDQEKKNTSYWFPYTHKAPIDTYLTDKYVVATSFDFDVADKDRLVSGINTLGSNAQMFYNQIGDTTVSTANTSTVFVLCTSMVQIYAGATLKIVQ